MSPLLKKSFDPAKCKTLLQITGQKLKVLRNKHALAVKNLRADVARLLEKKQDESAKLEVDRVYREEKIVVLYNLLEQFCLFLSSHIETMKSQRECPLELKEAVASLIYAATRCDEIEELKKVSVYLTRRYGTEFSLAAKELHSGCSVNTQVIENLSSLSLSLDGKIKLLKEIATEKKINWDYSAYEQHPGSHLLEDTITQSGSGTSTSTLSHGGFEGQNPSSMRVHEVGGQQSGALKNVVSSQILSPKASLDSHTQSMQGPGLSGKNVRAFISDPYALAKLQGKLDYKFIADSLAVEHVVEEHTQTPISLQSDDQSLLAGSLRMAPKQPIDSAARQELERQLMQLETVTKVAYESATEAAKATKLVVSMVRKQTVEMRNLQLEGIKNPVGRHGESSFSPVLAESSFDHVGDKLRFAPSEEDLGLGAALNNVAPEDVGEIQSKYVVSEQKIGSQWSSPREELAKGNIMKPMIESLRSTDGKQLEVDWKSSHGEKQENFYLQEKSMRSLPRYDDSISDDEEMPHYYPEKASPGQQQQQHKDLSSVAEMQQGREGLKESAKPQFDDDDDSASNEEEEMTYNASESERSRQQQQQQQQRSLSGEAELQQDEDGWREYAEPQLDDDSEEEIPFYLKGRAAQMKADFDDELAGAPSRKLGSAGLHNSTEEYSAHSLHKKVSLNLHSPRKQSFNFSSQRSDENDESNPADSRHGGASHSAGSSASPTEGPLDHEEGHSPAIQVRRRLKYGSASSEHHPEPKAESSIESDKPSRPEGSSALLQSPKLPSAASSSSSNNPDPNSPLSRRTSYTGFFKRALRSSWQ